MTAYCLESGELQLIVRKLAAVFERVCNNPTGFVANAQTLNCKRCAHRGHGSLHSLSSICAYRNLKPGVTV